MTKKHDELVKQVNLLTELSKKWQMPPENRDEQEEAKEVGENL